jgi:hypothetical protein
LRTAQKLSNFTMLAFGRVWIEGPGDLIDYLEMKFLQPCGRTVPFEVLKAVMLIEHLGRISPKVSENILVQGAVESWTSALSVGAAATKKAPDFPLAMVIALELLVLDEEELLFLRWFAGVKLVKLGAGLRWDDTVGIPSTTLQKL